MERKSNWQKDLEKWIVQLDWASVKEMELENLLMMEIEMMLRDSAWRMVEWKWEVEEQKRSKLGVMQKLLVHGSKDRCIDVERIRLSWQHVLQVVTYVDIATLVQSKAHKCTHTHN